MSPKIVQVNFKFSIPRADLEAAFLQAAQPIAETPGMQWKIWLMDEANHTAGGIYLFDGEESVQAYLAGPIVASLKSNPVLSDLGVKVFDVLPTHTAITRGPVAAGLGAFPQIAVEAQA